MELEEKEEKEEGNKLSPPAPADDDLSTPPPQTLQQQEKKKSSPSSSSELFDRLIRVPVKHDARSELHRDLTPSEFLDFLTKQGTQTHSHIITPDGNSNSHQGSSNTSQTMQGKDRNRDYQSVAIDQCDITSPVDYGSRDYYNPSSTHTSDTYVYQPKTDELDELYKKSTDTRGNWWEGSYNY